VERANTGSKSTLPLRVMPNPMNALQIKTEANGLVTAMCAYPILSLATVVEPVRQFAQAVSHGREVIAGIPIGPPEPSAPHGTPQSDLCIICCDRERAIVLIPCGHFHLCRTCAQRLDKCGVCCAKVQAHQRVFK